MSLLSGNEETTCSNTDCTLPMVDTYANAILRTLSSLKPPSPPIALYTSRQHRRSYPHAKTVSQSVVVNEVSGMWKLYMGTYSSLSHCYFQVEIDGHSTFFLSFSSFIRFTSTRSAFMSYIQDVMIFRLSLILNISFCVHILLFFLDMWWR